MFRVFGFATALVFAVSEEVVVFGAVVTAPCDPDVLLAVVPFPAAEPAAAAPFAGVDVVGAAGGSVVSGFGSGGNGLAITPAIRSVRPTSDWL